ncbi:testis-specific serine/threonine-protein kinase 6 [Periophthalmus magnuspinnatus]|uniref:testis-specific serine/threonine-protein kinase 6 n=1 Tax=Periophthalmus magnuspinnatus TaxID=409849 RepID=UPI00145C1765|nr:testis-specific serine/threonine-protein kinase 6 [Periophthalmus magnuspinnatus]
MSLGAKDKLFMEKHGLTFQKSLGEGRYGTVVKAYSCHTRQHFAVKVIDRTRAEKPYLEKFLSRELEIVKCLKHPNVVTTHHVFEQSGSKVFVVMELCVNDLSDYMKTNGALSEERSRTFLAQLCAAVQYLHGNDITHRDLKCENLLLDQKQNIKVCDFGMSKRLTYTDGRLDLSDTFCGTDSYAAPEILRGLPYNPVMADVWSVGVILFKMLYDALPFSSGSVLKMVQLQMKRDINFLDSHQVSPDAVGLVQRLLHPDVEHRISVAGVLESPWMQQREKRAEGAAASSNVGPGETTGEDGKDSTEGHCGKVKVKKR